MRVQSTTPIFPTSSGRLSGAGSYLRAEEPPQLCGRLHLLPHHLGAISNSITSKRRKSYRAKPMAGRT